MPRVPKIESRERFIFSGSVLFVGPKEVWLDYRGNAVSDQRMKVGGVEIRKLDFYLGNIQSNI